MKNMGRNQMALGVLYTLFQVGTTGAFVVAPRSLTPKTLKAPTSSKICLKSSNLRSSYSTAGTSSVSPHWPERTFGRDDRMAPPLQRQQHPRYLTENRGYGRGRGVYQDQAQAARPNFTGERYPPTETYIGSNDRQYYARQQMEQQRYRGQDSTQYRYTNGRAYNGGYGGGTQQYGGTQQQRYRGPVQPQYNNQQGYYNDNVRYNNQVQGYNGGGYSARGYNSGNSSVRPSYRNEYRDTFTQARDNWWEKGPYTRNTQGRDFGTRVPYYDRNQGTAASGHRRGGGTGNGFYANSNSNVRENNWRTYNNRQGVVGRSGTYYDRPGQQAGQQSGNRWWDDSSRNHGVYRRQNLDHRYNTAQNRWWDDASYRRTSRYGGTAQDQYRYGGNNRYGRGDEHLYGRNSQQQYGNADGRTRQIQGGGAVKTFSSGYPYSNTRRDDMHVTMGNDGRPIHAELELWDGPNNTPQRVRTYSQDGYTNRFQGTFSGGGTMRIKNTGPTEFPADVQVTSSTPLPPGSGYQGMHTREGAVTIDGGALKTWSFDDTIDSVYLELESDGAGGPVNAVVELWQGPDNVKQVAEIYSDDGEVRPYAMMVDTTDRYYGSCTIAVRNTGPMTFPLLARLTPRRGY